MAKVLIVDDDAANRLLLTSLLKYAGHEAVEASDGDEGLRAAAALRPELIIMDLSMPHMDGAHFIKELRRLPDVGATKVALYTGTQVDAMLLDFMAVHRISHVIPKPAEPDDLLRAIAQALDGR